MSDPTLRRDLTQLSADCPAISASIISRATSSTEARLRLRTHHGDAAHLTLRTAAFTGYSSATDDDPRRCPHPYRNESAGVSIGPADLACAWRQAQTLRDTSQRPWPVPDGPWIMGQTWERLLFAHWRIDETWLRRFVPAQIPIDTFDGSAWLAVTPFLVSGLRLRLLPPLPGTARFPEINVRTYATIEDRPGIHFFSLDVPNVLAIAAARRAYRLPYFHSKIEVRDADGRVSYHSRRVDPAGAPVGCAIDYRPTGPGLAASSESFEYWAAERYCLYTLDDRGRVLRGEIHHPPWQIQPAEATIESNSMGRQLGCELQDPPVLHYAHRQDVVFWPNQLVGAGR
jgi:uncharacterized protein